MVWSSKRLQMASTSIGLHGSPAPLATRTPLLCLRDFDLTKTARSLVVCPAAASYTSSVTGTYHAGLEDRPFRGLEPPRFRLGPPNSGRRKRRFISLSLRKCSATSPGECTRGPLGSAKEALRLMASWSAGATA